MYKRQVQASPFKLTAPEQFKEFADNTVYFVFEPNIHDLNDLGWRYLAQHMDCLLYTSLSEDADLLAAEAAYCAMEDELREYLDTYEQTHDYDEYLLVPDATGLGA